MPDIFDPNLQVGDTTVSNQRVMFVATKNGDVINPADLCHDVGACLLGGKDYDAGGMSDKIRVETLQDVIENNLGFRPSLEQLVEKGVSGGTYTTDTWLLDALVKGDLQYRSIKY